MKSKEQQHFKKIIVDYHKLSYRLLDLLVQEFPYGYDESDIIRFQNHKGERVECVEVRTEDTIYLVKIGKRLEHAMEGYSPGETEDVEGDSLVVDFVAEEQDEEEAEINPEEPDDHDE